MQYIRLTRSDEFTKKLSQQVDDYLKRIEAKGDDGFFEPMDNKQVIRHLLQESSQCFSEEKHCYKQKELLQLSSLLDQAL